jgi:hypothetical protein
LVKWRNGFVQISSAGRISELALGPKGRGAKQGYQQKLNHQGHEVALGKVLDRGALCTDA